MGVDMVDLRVRQGEIVGIIGPNGAGKTTLFDLLSGFLTPDDGRVLLAGTDVTGWSPDARARAGLGRSFQDARLFPSLTVREAIAVAHDRHLRYRDPASGILALPDQRVEEGLVAQRVDELIERLGLGAFADKFVSELSTGSQVPSRRRIRPARITTAPGASSRSTASASSDCSPIRSSPTRMRSSASRS